MNKELKNKVTEKLEQRAKAKVDKLYLATEILGYDFCEVPHAELFSKYIPFDSSKAWVEQSSIKNRLILWPRGHYKSTSMVVECIQAILNFPDIRILLMQGTLKTTKRMLAEIASHFTGTANNSRLAELFPEFCGTKKQIVLTADSFTTPARVRKQTPQATVTVASPRATKTGQHYDMAIFDDLVNDQNYRSPDLLKKVQEDFDMCQPLLDPGSYRYVTGTRYVFGDLYETITRRNKGEWVITIKDCWTDDGKEVRFPQRPAKDGRIIGFTRELLLQIQNDDAEMFASQYLNKPIAAKSQLFTEETVLSAVRASDNTPALGPKILVIDLAASDSASADHSVIACGQTDTAGRIYVSDLRGDHYTPLALVNVILAMALVHRPLRILVESTAAGTYFIEYLRACAREKGMVLPIDVIKVNNKKDAKYLRIAALEGALKQKRLMFLAGLPRWEMLVEQLTTFPKGRHDDYPDAVALMLQFFQQQTITTPRIEPSANPLLQEILRRAEPVKDPASLLQQRSAQDSGLGADFASD